MKPSWFMKTVAILVFAMAIPSIAAAQYGEARLDKWLDGHQDVKAELQRNPSLIYDRQWRHEHPGLQEFMQNHPQVWGKIPNSGRYGAYGPDNHLARCRLVASEQSRLDKPEPSRVDLDPSGLGRTSRWRSWRRPRRLRRASRMA